MKRFFTDAYKQIVILTLVLSLFFINSAANAAENFERVAPGIYQMTDGSTLSGVFARGIDVSRWQGTIDWESVAKNDVKFAMIATRNRRTGTADQYFHTNMQGAHKNGIALGAYIYSYALNPEEAKLEAEFVLNLIKDYPITYPIAFDVEDEVEQGKMTKAQLSAIIDAFCDTIKDAGYYPIVYANEHWLKNKLDESVSKKYPIWVARYAPRYTFSNPVMWQATGTGKVGGVTGNVDINFQFADFHNTTPANTWRTILGERYYYSNYQMQKNTWANDGNRRYYLSQNGTVHKGWLNLSNREYYLHPKSGELTRGWEKFDEGWSFFDAEGVLKRGWVSDDDKWYLLDKNGYMLTNWVKTGGVDYFLHPNGSMATGWIKQDDTWLYLRPDGSLAKGWILDDGKWYFLDKYGNMLTGSVLDNNRLYYQHPDGSMATGWIKHEEDWYYYGPSGAMQSGWIQDGDSWYFLGEDGKMAIGLHFIDGVGYYFERTGRMLQNTMYSMDGVDYMVEQSGAIVGLSPQGSSVSGASKEVRTELTSIRYTQDLGKSVIYAFDLDAQLPQSPIQTTSNRLLTPNVETKAQGEMK